MKIGDKVQVVDKPISLLKQHAGIKGKIVKKGIGNEWLYDIEVITQNQIQKFTQNFLGYGADNI